MGVYIKGMEMPNGCKNCRMIVYHENTGKTWCTLADAILAEGYKTIPFDGRPDWCPLTEIPQKHGDLIDRDQLVLPSEDIGSKFAVRYAPAVIKAEGDE